MKQFFSLLLSAFAVQLSSAQNIGIGTTTPAAPLHIKSNASEILRLQGNSPYMGFFNPDGEYIGYLWQGPGINMSMGTAPGNIFAQLRFYTAGNLNMTIDPSSKVGIGTSDPDYKLTIFENAIQSNTNTHVLKLKGQNPVLSFSDPNNNSYGYIKMWSYQPFAPYTNGMVIGANPGYPLFFSTNNYNVSMMIHDNGNVGLGTTNPQAKLHLHRDNEALRLSGNQPYLSMYNGSNYKGYLWNKGIDDIELGTAAVNTNGNLFLSSKGIQALTVQNDGRVRVGALACVLPLAGTNEPPKLSVNGAIGLRSNVGDQIAEWAFFIYNNTRLDVFYNGGHRSWISGNDGSWNTFSDVRLKENFEPYKPVLDRIKKLDVLTYQFKADKTNTRSFGLVAQNVQQYFPEIVSSTGGKDNLLGMDYSKTGVLAIKAIQEQQVIIEKQQKQIDELRKLVTELLQRK